MKISEKIFFTKTKLPLWESKTKKVLNNRYGPSTKKSEALHNVLNKRYSPSKKSDKLNNDLGGYDPSKKWKTANVLKKHDDSIRTYKNN